jgi:hypothetical protein
MNKEWESPHFQNHLQSDWMNFSSVTAVYMCMCGTKSNSSLNRKSFQFYQIINMLRSSINGNEQLLSLLRHRTALNLSFRNKVLRIPVGECMCLHRCSVKSLTQSLCGICLLRKPIIWRFRKKFLGCEIRQVFDKHTHFLFQLELINWHIFQFHSLAVVCMCVYSLFSPTNQNMTANGVSPAHSLKLRQRLIDWLAAN